MTSAAPRPFAVNFALIMVGLRAALGAACGRPALAGRVVDQPRRSLAGPLALRLHARLGKMMQEFAALVAHLAAFGADPPSRAPRRKPAPRPDAAGSATARDIPKDIPQDSSWGAAAAVPPESPPRAPRAPRLPSNFGWLPGLSTSVAIGASQLRHLLTDPELLALLHTSPALVRMLRPLCWMLGVELPAAVLPPRPAPADAGPDAEPKPPRRRRRRLWRPPSRRSDMLRLLRMGTPLIRT